MPNPFSDLVPASPIRYGLINPANANTPLPAYEFADDSWQRTGPGTGSPGTYQPVTPGVSSTSTLAEREAAAAGLPPVVPGSVPPATPPAATPPPPPPPPPATTSGSTSPVIPAANALAAWDAFRNSTNYKWRLAQGLEAINMGYAARGVLQSGAAQLALNDHAQNFAANELANYQQMLANQQTMGANAAGNLAGVGNMMVNQVSANNNNAGSAAANAALIAGQAGANSAITQGQGAANMWGAIGSGVGQVAGALGSSYSALPSPGASTGYYGAPTVNAGYGGPAPYLPQPANPVPFGTYGYNP